MSRKTLSNTVERASTDVDRQRLLSDYRGVRGASVDMCRPLTPEMYRVQPMEDVSPPWWNLGHTSWFFVRNALEPFGGESLPEDADFDYVLNSYYASLGPRRERERRGTATFPSTDDVFRYRESVDSRMERLIETVDAARWERLAEVVTIGLNHEQQHQELFYTEIKYILWQNPPRLRRGYREAPPTASVGIEPAPCRYVEFAGGPVQIGHQESGFCWDNELPVHTRYLPPYALANRLVTNGEYLQFVRDGGYQNQLLWLDNGWKCVETFSWQAPLYWEKNGANGFDEWTLHGLAPLALNEPVAHLSFYEADAFARWRSETFSEDRGATLPDEAQWEHAARAAPLADADGFLNQGRLKPPPADDRPALAQMFGALWQWTASYYEPYPGYRPFAGALSEYNSKFMDNQRVLRGGACVTERNHFHVAYRNFWPAPTRFQFTGLRLARYLH